MPIPKKKKKKQNKSISQHTQLFALDVRFTQMFTKYTYAGQYYKYDELFWHIPVISTGIQM